MRTISDDRPTAHGADQAFPHLTDDWDVDDISNPAAGADAAIADETDGGDDVSIGSFEAEVAQASDMMDILEQIAGIQQQQLEHQRSALLSDTRQVFFALAVSVAVIFAGIAPLVDASPDQRRLILLWTAAVCTVARCVYAAVRALQSRSG